MAIIKRSSFTLVLSALLSVSVYGQSSVKYASCFFDNGDNVSGDGSTQSTGDGNAGSRRRTFGNLCAGNPTTAGGTGTAIPSRDGFPFQTLCGLIEANTNILDLMASGNSPHTIFAPTDAAFNKVNGLLARVDLDRVLELHLLPQARLTRDLRCGQTYRTVNTRQSRRDNQRSKTRCVSAGRSQQIGPGNVVNGLKPTIGVPGNIFFVDQFPNQDHFVVNENDTGGTNEKDTFGQDVISCNGVIHVVDEVLLPGGNNAFNRGGDYYNNGAVDYYGDYYGARPPADYYGDYYGGDYYYGPPRNNRARARVGYGAKGSKGGKGGKVHKGRSGRSARRAPLGNGGFRKLDTDADAFEMPMSDAEFFGTNGLVEKEANIDGKSSEEDLSNRKRRLEAMLEPDGNIAQV
jgi:hypothetical protein